MSQKECHPYFYIRVRPLHPHIQRFRRRELHSCFQRYILFALARICLIKIENMFKETMLQKM